MEKRFLPLEDSGKEATKHGSEGDPHAEKQDDLEQVGEFHWAILDTAGYSSRGAPIPANA